jgi:hypothetical protein
MVHPGVSYPVGMTVFALTSGPRSSERTIMMPETVIRTELERTFVVVASVIIFDVMATTAPLSPVSRWGVGRQGRSDDRHHEHAVDVLPVLVVRVPKTESGRTAAGSDEVVEPAELVDRRLDERFGGARFGDVGGVADDVAGRDIGEFFADHREFLLVAAVDHDVRSLSGEGFGGGRPQAALAAGVSAAVSSRCRSMEPPGRAGAGKTARSYV